MLVMFDSTGNRVVDWKVGRAFKFPADIDSIDINMISISGLELNFLVDKINGLVYPKNNGTVIWFAGTAKSVASILEHYTDLEKESAAFLERHKRVAGAKAQVGEFFEKTKAVIKGD